MRTARGNVRRMECSGPASVVFDKSLTEYDFGPTHPMSPLRVDLTMRLAEELGVLERLRVVPAPIATREQIASVHDEAMIDAVTKCGTVPGWTDEARGLGLLLRQSLLFLLFMGMAISILMVLAGIG